jgi:hypothetical protein
MANKRNRYTAIGVDSRSEDFSEVPGDRNFGEQRIGPRSSFASPMQRTWGQENVTRDGRDAGVKGFRSIGSDNKLTGNSGVSRYTDIQGNVQGKGEASAGGESPFDAVFTDQAPAEAPTIGGMKRLKTAIRDGSFGTGGSSIRRSAKGGIDFSKDFGFTVGEEPAVENKPKGGIYGFSMNGTRDERSADGGGKTRSFNGELDDLVYEGSMSDKDRQTVTKALLRKHGPRGVLS